MRQNVRIARVMGTLAVACTLAMGLSACGSSAIKADFAKAPDQRPLELPPALEITTSAQSSASSVTASQAVRPAQMAVANAGFTLAGDRDAVYARVGELLESMEGLQIASRAQLLGSYDVAFQGSNFLVRVVAVEAGVYVSAVDPRGQPATGTAAEAVLSSLKSALGG